MKEKLIPEKGKEFVDKWASKIFPLLRKEFDNTIWHFVDRSDHFTQSYPWNAELSDKAENLSLVTEIRTLHSYGHYGFFKPSVAEVLQQIPEELLDRVDYFLVDGPEDADDLNKEKEMLNAGYHVASTKLYAKRKNVG